MNISSKELSQPDTVMKSSIKNTVSGFLLGAIVVTCLTGCPKRPPETKPPEEKFRRPEIVQPEDETTPERQAAAELVNDGIAAVQDEDWEEAEWHFQEAIRIAPSYGPAYYWLARTKYALEQMTQAWNLLDKAELLIGQDPDWLDRIDQLRQAISDYQESQTPATENNPSYQI